MRSTSTPTKTKPVHRKTIEGEMSPRFETGDLLDGLLVALVASVALAMVVVMFLG